MGVLVGYSRVSTVGQSLDVQIEQLLAAGCEEVFQEKRSGTTRHGRTELEAALRFVRKGDVLCVTRLDRLARSMTDLAKILDQLAEKQVGFKVLQQALDTTTNEGRLMLHIMGAFAEFETAIRKERQAEGIVKAKVAGKYRGRKASIDPVQVAALKTSGLGASAIARKLGIGRASVYRLHQKPSVSDVDL
jgi:DNA invertase Pin-like site-specific DNA recombinase